MTDGKKLEVGWVLAGRLEETDRRAAARARHQMRTYLEAAFPAFDWRFPTVSRREAAIGQPAEPVDLIDMGAVERDERGWDFALVITQAELQSYDKPFALGAPSQSVHVAVASTARLEPAALSTSAEGEGAARGNRTQTAMGHRLFALLMHLFGHLNDLDHTDDAHDFMHNLRSIDHLDTMEHYGPGGQAHLVDELKEVADVRLEETGRYRRQTALFYLRASWINRREIFGAVAQISPWEFPLRFSRLTTAAISTLVVLIITAEAWELGMSQPPWLVGTLSALALAGASAYLLKRQRLLSRRRMRRLSEQRVVANVSVATALTLGMVSTYLLLFGVTLAISTTLFSPELVERWASLPEGQPLGPGNYLILAGFVAALGLVIGALGASFEEEGYFRHIAFVDEET